MSELEHSCSWYSTVDYTNAQSIDLLTLRSAADTLRVQTGEVRWCALTFAFAVLTGGFSQGESANINWHCHSGATETACCSGSDFLFIHAFLWQTINKIFRSSIVPDPLLDNLAAAERIESELTRRVETRGLYWRFQGEFMSVKRGQECFSKKHRNKIKTQLQNFALRP